MPAGPVALAVPVGLAALAVPVGLAALAGPVGLAALAGPVAPTDPKPLTSRIKSVFDRWWALDRLV
jgi:hypothetical protein